MSKIEVAFKILDGVNGDRTVYLELAPDTIPNAGDRVRLVGEATQGLVPGLAYTAVAVGRTYDMDTSELTDVWVSLGAML